MIEKLPAEAKYLWHIPVGDGLSSPVVYGDKAFYVDNQKGRETLHAVKTATGVEIWQADVDSVHSDSQSVPGPRCSPTTDGKFIYAQSCKGQLRCFHVSDGKEVWSVNYTTHFTAIYTGENGKAQGSQRHGNSAGPLLENKRLYASVGGNHGDSVVCFEAKSGKVLWKSQDDISGYSTPILANFMGKTQFISFTAEGLMGLDAAKGDLLWRVPFKTSYGRHVVTPNIYSNMVVISSHEFGMQGVQVSVADGKWTAQSIWTNKAAAENFASPVSLEDHLYGVGPNADFDCVDMVSGKLEWSQKGYFGGSGGNAYGGFLTMQDRVLALTDSGQLVLFAASPKEFKLISSVQVCGKNWCNPAYSEGKLYFRDNHTLYCLPLQP